MHVPNLIWAWETERFGLFPSAMAFYLSRWWKTKANETLTLGVFIRFLSQLK